MTNKDYDLFGVHGAEIFRDLDLGLKLRMKNGAIGEIIGNPHDGAVMQLRYLEYPEDPNRVGTEDFIFYTEVDGVVS